MESWKGHDQLLEAAAKMRRELPWVVWFVGGAQRHDEETYLGGPQNQGSQPWHS